VVALDPRSGEILAMVSHPAPNPNDFAVRISNEEWKQLNDDQAKPLLNRAIQAQLAPGSVFKIIMATAMLEDKLPPASFHGILSCVRDVLRPAIQVLGIRKDLARLRGSAQSDRRVLRHLLFTMWGSGGH